MSDRLSETLPDHPDDELQLAPFAVGQVVQAVPHHLQCRRA
jgi:hypothetical protein